MSGLLAPKPSKRRTMPYSAKNALLGALLRAILRPANLLRPALALAAITGVAAARRRVLRSSLTVKAAVFAFLCTSAARAAVAVLHPSWRRRRAAELRLREATTLAEWEAARAALDVVAARSRRVHRAAVSAHIRYCGPPARADSCAIFILPLVSLRRPRWRARLAGPSPFPSFRLATASYSSCALEACALTRQSTASTICSFRFARGWLPWPSTSRATLTRRRRPRTRPKLRKSVARSRWTRQTSPALGQPTARACLTSA